MLAYILSFEDLSVRDILNFDKYEFQTDIEYTTNSYIIVPRKPIVDNKDFIWCKNDENETVFVGICDTYSTHSDDQGYTINMRQKEQYFSRQIFLGNETVKTNTGVEDFIVQEINSNWINAGDPVMDIPYLTARALTHTPVAASVTADVTMDNGVYNLKSYMGNCKERYQIYTEFVFSGQTLTVNIFRKDDPVLPIDIKVSDITEYDESYEVDTMARVMVKWKIPDTINADGTVNVGAVTYKNFYLRNNRTVTENINDPDRADGTSISIYVEAESQYDMRQQAMNEFAGNRYKHQVNFKLKRGSRLYNTADYYVGRQCRFKSKTGIQDTIITKIIDNSDTELLDVTFGKLAITLIQKLRRFYA